MARIRRRAGLVSTTLSSVAVVSMALAPAASASGTAWDEPFWCVSYDVNTYPPHVSTNGAPELVRWEPVIVKAVNGQWTLVEFGPWSVGTFNNQGQAIASWADAATGVGLSMRRFTYNQAGAYAVLNIVQWSDLTQRVSWVPTAAPGYCTLPAALPGYGAHPAVDDPAAEVAAAGPGGIAGAVAGFARGLVDLVSGALARDEVEAALVSPEAPPAPS